MNTALSNRIKWLNLFFTLIIVLNHCTALAPPDAIYCQLINSLRMFAMMFFFFVSGYLYFLDFEPSKILPKLLKRVRTLLVPFLLWDGIGFCLLTVERTLKFGTFTYPSFNEVIASFNFRQQYGRINFDGPIWYLTMVFLLVVIAPAIWLLIKNKWIGWISIAAASFAMLYYKAPYISTFYWLPSFASGGLFALHYQSLLAAKSSPSDWIFKTLLIGFPILVAYACAFGYDWKEANLLAKGLLFCLSSAAVMIAFSSIDWPKYPKSRWLNTFWIFVCHYLVMNTVKAGFDYLGLSPSIGLFLLLFILTMAITMFGGWFVARFIPPLFRLLTGGRTEA